MELLSAQDMIGKEEEADISAYGGGSNWENEKIGQSVMMSDGKHLWYWFVVCDYYYYYYFTHQQN